MGKNRSDTVKSTSIKVKVTLDEITKKYVSRLTAEALERNLKRNLNSLYDGGSLPVRERNCHLKK